MNKMPSLAIIFSLLVLSACGDDRAPPGGENIAAFTAGMEARDGFVPFYLDRQQGRIYLVLEHFSSDMIYMHSLPQGVGSNDLGFDRGQLMDVLPALVRFERAGDKVLLHRRNMRFRAESDNIQERQSVDEAFASAVLWGFPVTARDGEVVLVDATDFLLRDAHKIGPQLKAAEQGNFQVDASRSALYYPRIKGFPRNSEFEATVTFTGTEAGDHLKQVVPDEENFSVRMHHSFIALPEPGYQPRMFLPDSGFWPFSFVDYATAINEPLQRRLIPRHRLEKKTPAASVSEPVEPITYYLDPGTPEPVRSALLEGASWWNDAFETAGYQDAFRVKLLPEGADPMDVRYNVIQWVHRATRGWSYGYGVTDPRTGEIIKGHVTLGSLRVRQDYLIAQGMTSPFDDVDSDDDALRAMALARIRQLSAHEVGHTLGLAHNFAASQRQRASVMDYPHPYIRLTESGDVTLDDAYAEGIGEWDKRAVNYGYADFGPHEAEKPALIAFVEEGRALGFPFISDPDSRAYSDMHPAGNLWDNGSDAVAELQRIVTLREKALAQFGENTLPFGQPYSSLEEVLVPIYYYHRFQVEAVAKWLGGSDYRYALRRPGQSYIFTPLPAAEQHRALDALIDTLDSQFLLLTQSLREKIPPKAYGYERTRESAPGNAGALLDPVTLAEASIQHTLNVLLHPARLARLELQQADDPAMPGVDTVLSALFRNVMKPTPSAMAGAIQRRAIDTLLRHWRQLAVSRDTPSQARAEVHASLRHSARWLESSGHDSDDYQAFYRYQLWQLEQFFSTSPLSEQPLVPLDMPPGSPIGSL